MVTSPAGELVTTGFKCFRCCSVGHMQQACPYFSSPNVPVAEKQGNSLGFRPQQKQKKLEPRRRSESSH
jgi:hypothetical protein